MPIATPKSRGPSSLRRHCLNCRNCWTTSARDSSRSAASARVTQLACLRQVRRASCRGTDDSLLASAAVWFRRNRVEDVAQVSRGDRLVAAHMTAEAVEGAGGGAVLSLLIGLHCRVGQEA